MIEKDPNLKPKLITVVICTSILAGLVVGGWLAQDYFIKALSVTTGGILGN